MSDVTRLASPVGSPVAAGFAPGATFLEARRELGVTGGAEKRLLLWLAARIPGRVGPDHLTSLGFGATLAAAALYAGSARWPWMVLLVNVALLLNWFGDSLDGTLARYRRTPRPRYGFYVDHLLDSVGVAALVGGLALGQLLRPWMAAALLVAYLLVSIEVFLATYTLSRFRIAWGGVGGTELRLLLAAANVAAFAWPGAIVGTWSVFDLVAGAALPGLAVAFVTSSLANGRELYRAERIA